MSLNKLLKDSIQMHVPAVWVETTDSIGVQLELQRLAHEMPMTFIAWDLVRGVSIPHSSEPCIGDPVGAAGLGSRHRIAERPTALLLHNYHWHLNRMEVVQALLNAIGNARAVPTTIVIAAPRIPLSKELEANLRFVVPGLPSFEEIRQMATPLLDGVEDPCQEIELIEGLSGLTCLEVRTIVHQVRTAKAGNLLRTVLSRKAEILERHTLLRRQESQDVLGSIHGMSYLAEHCRRILPTGFPTPSRGLFLLGPTGCGKTAFSVALGNELRRPVFALDWTRLTGDAAALERAVQDSFTRLEAMAPAIFLLDDISTQVVRLGSILEGNGLTRIWTLLVEWLTGHQADVFTVATGNCVGHVPLELLHPDRLDALFFVDLPSNDVQVRLWERFRAEFEISPSDAKPDSVGWTGGEIRTCCRRAAHQGCSLQHAASSIVPLSEVSAENLQALRLWANGRSRSVECSQTYQHLPQWNNRRFIDPSVN